MQTMAKSFRSRYLLTLSLLLAGPCLAADNSVVSTVALTIPPLASIAQLDDIDLGDWSGSKGMSAETSVCVWSSSRAYAVTAMSTNPVDGDFTLAGPNASHIIYTVEWTDASANPRALAHGQSTGSLASPAKSAKCSDADALAAPTKFKVSIHQRELARATTGRYSDTLQLVVSAE
ncbi:hypothetical protein [Zhongshania sp.]|uniref:hypothetical protein n=1 Tax=Zhongshania sp. TaxID=1971902 RepID=UPI00356A2022